MHSLLGRKKKAADAGNDPSPISSLPHAPRMFSCVGCFWVLLSSALVAICSFSFISPAWIVRDQRRNEDSVSFGLLWHCSESPDQMYRCYTFGGLGKFAEIPSSSWQPSGETLVPFPVLPSCPFASPLRAPGPAQTRLSAQERFVVPALRTLILQTWLHIQSYDIWSRPSATHNAAVCLSERYSPC
ncbi:hypothetical protein AAFF_G00272680 [Aldrovandia affinis]|uniref:Uncharacterized protein n=1 Tax=Aldrovandia affinis TaxID=143900 RepID=A0AAD7RAP6_9TELE|nr:hypothetical protein AAFF_G00272680 [Aldrovandia affinis]